LPLEEMGDRSFKAWVKSFEAFLEGGNLVIRLFC